MNGFSFCFVYLMIIIVILILIYTSILIYAKKNCIFSWYYFDETHQVTPLLLQFCVYSNQIRIIVIRISLIRGAFSTTHTHSRASFTFHWHSFRCLIHVSLKPFQCCTKQIRQYTIAAQLWPFAANNREHCNLEAHAARVLTCIYAH